MKKADLTPKCHKCGKKLREAGWQNTLMCFKCEKLPDPWTHWDFYYDPRPVPFPRRCKCCKRVFNDKEEDKKFGLEHHRDCMCSTNLRTFPPYLETDNWEPTSGDQKDVSS